MFVTLFRFARKRMPVMVNVKMAKRGAITIPKSLREVYGMQPCDVFALVDLGGLFVLGPR